MDIKTLDQSLDHIAKQSATIQGLENDLKLRNAEFEVLATDFKSCVELCGLQHTESGWESSKLNGLSEKVQELTATRDAVTEKLGKAEVRITELLSEQKSVAARALEFLAAQGGKPLPLSGTGKPAPSGKAQIMEAMDEARKAGDQDAVKRYFKEYQNLKKS